MFYFIIIIFITCISWSISWSYILATTHPRIGINFCGWMPFLPRTLTSYHYSSGLGPALNCTGFHPSTGWQSWKPSESNMSQQEFEPIQNCGEVAPNLPHIIILLFASPYSSNSPHFLAFLFLNKFFGFSEDFEKVEILLKSLFFFFFFYKSKCYIFHFQSF